MKQIVITGYGATSPLGGDAESTWEGLLAGRSGVRTLAADWTADLPVKFAAPVAVDPATVLDRVEARRLDRSSQLSIVAAMEAWQRAGFTPGDGHGLDRDRLGVVVATGAHLPAPFSHLVRRVRGETVRVRAEPVLDERLSPEEVEARWRQRFDEMKEALDLASKSGIHRLITALEERGFLRRLAHRARALEVLKLPESAVPQTARGNFRPSVISGEGRRAGASARGAMIPVMGRIAAGTAIEAIENETHKVNAPDEDFDPDTHFALEVSGESMINAGILDGDTVIIRSGQSATPGDIVVALIDDNEATLKRFRRKGASIALEAANPAYETKIYGSERVKVKGKLIGLIRSY